MWTFGHSFNADQWFTGWHGGYGAPQWGQPLVQWAPWAQAPQPAPWSPPHTYTQPWQQRAPVWSEPEPDWYGRQTHPFEPMGDHYAQDYGGRHSGHNTHWYCPEPEQPESAYAGLVEEEVRTANGTANNQGSTDWGAVDATFIRLAPADYADGISEPVDRGNPREISNAIAAQSGDILNSFGASDLFTYFGQFIDHDIDLTLDDRTDSYTSDIPAGDPVFTTKTEFEIGRSTPVDGTGVTTPREHANVITSYLDASNIYGSSDTVTALLRGDGGLSAYMLTSDGDYAPTLGQIREENPNLPLPDQALAVGGATDDFFVAGDVRSNENVALTSMHTVWMREHNHQVDVLKELHPEWSQDELFNAARIIVEAEYQNVVFGEYLPLLLGAENIPNYQGYDATVNAGIAHEFASAAYRLGHSQISSTIHRTNEDGTTSALGDLNLFEAFFQPKTLVDGGGVDPIIRGLTSNLGQEIDPQIVDDVRNLLFGPPGEGQDLAVLNLMRGRDHGIPGLNDVREALGLERFADFSELTSDPGVVAKFASVYATIDDVDLWIGGLAEDNVSGSQLGATFHTIVLDQFMRLRDGDRMYFEERLAETPELLSQIKNTSFSEIIQRTTGIDYLQDDVFISHDRIGGGAQGDRLVGSATADLVMGYDGNDVLKGKQGDDDLYGGAGRDVLKGGTGNDVINGGEGNDKMWGGRGEDLFVFTRDSGRDRIYRFEANRDTLDISDYGFQSYEEVAQAAWQQGRKLVIQLDEHSGDQVQLIGVKLKDLGEHNFIIDDDEALIA